MFKLFNKLHLTFVLVHYERLLFLLLWLYNSTVKIHCQAFFTNFLLNIYEYCINDFLINFKQNAIICKCCTNIITDRCVKTQLAIGNNATWNAADFRLYEFCRSFLHFFIFLFLTKWCIITSAVPKIKDFDRYENIVTSIRAIALRLSPPTVLSHNGIV